VAQCREKRVQRAKTAAKAVVFGTNAHTTSEDGVHMLVTILTDATAAWGGVTHLSQAWKLHLVLQRGIKGSRLKAIQDGG